MEPLKITNIDDLHILQAEINLKDEVAVVDFIAPEWNVYYNLNNPENFEDPNNPPEWYNSWEIYEAYTQPLFTPNQVVIYGKSFATEVLFKVNAIAKKLRKMVLQFLEDYTFNNGSHIDGKYFTFAKQTIEQAANQQLTQTAFLQKNIYLQAIQCTKQLNNVLLYIQCSWSLEHPLILNVNIDTLEIKIHDE